MSYPDLLEKSVKQNPQMRHELLNCLNQIIGYSEMLAEDAEVNGHGDMIGDLTKINCAAMQMLHNLNSLDQCASRCLSSIDTKRFAQSRRKPPTECEKTGTSLPEKSGNANILVVDDSSTNQDILSRHLQRQGYRAATADSGQQALLKLAKEAFDLVLLDVIMPDMNGYEVLQLMKADAALVKVPVIIISACADIDHVINCIEIGAEDYLPKPFNPVLLKARINATLEKKRLREQELNYISQAMQAEASQERHRALTQAVAGVAHEINTPLGIVKTALSVIKNRLVLPELQALFKRGAKQQAWVADILESVDLMVRNVDNAHRLIENFKKIAVDQLVVRKEPVNFPELLKDAVDLFKISARQAKLDIALDVAAVEGQEWYGYPGYLTQIMMNFLQNIERYAYPDGAGGKVEIIAAGLKEPGKPEQFVVSVRDVGVGISQENVGKIFEPFFTTGRHQGGTGLGLAIVKNMVTDALQGSLEVESQLGKGTCFTVCFPKRLSDG